MATLKKQEVVRIAAVGDVHCSKTSAGTLSTTSVCTVTTAGATRATACVIAVRLEPATSSVVDCSGDAGAEDCAEDGALDAP